MLNSLNALKGFLLLFVVFVLILSIQPSNARVNEDLSESADDTDEYQAREQALKKLRHFLLTSSAEQRAAKRTQQNLHKRKLVWQTCSLERNPIQLDRFSPSQVREYLDSLNDADPDRAEQMKSKRRVTEKTPSPVAY